MQSSKGSALASASINHDISQLSESQTRHCIYRVHKHLRYINNQAYDPESIAIGPYHHGNKDTYKMMEKHKLRYLKELLRRKKQNVEQYTSVVEELEERARDCYAEPISLSQAEFIKMLVLDGCFIIELIKRWHENDSYCNYDPIFQMQWVLNSLTRDLILFENQIPFFVLCELFDLIEAPNQHNKLVYLILNFFEDLYPGTAGLRFDMDCGEIKHWLHLIHTSWLPSFDNNNNNNNNNNNVSIDTQLPVIHSATQLKDANVTFSKREESKSLFHVGFENGTMVMPELRILDRTECVFRNLIAYEQCFPDRRRNFVMDYVNLLDCLINSSGDVEILSRRGIINNYLGDNEVVARIFNRLGDSVAYVENYSTYAEMMDRVNKYYRRPWNRAVAKLRRDYFNSPWAYFTVASAVVLLLLTVAQTVLSALQLM